MTVKQWNIDITIDEHNKETRAEARLRKGEQTRLTGIGLARRNPSDANVPEIGDELATSRALADLSHKLLDAAADDIEHVVHRPVHLKA
jgi:Domain of unknown function (DUF1876)